MARLCRCDGMKKKSQKVFHLPCGSCALSNCERCSHIENGEFCHPREGFGKRIFLAVPVVAFLLEPSLSEIAKFAQSVRASFIKSRLLHVASFLSQELVPLSLDSNLRFFPTSFFIAMWCCSFFLCLACGFSSFSSKLWRAESSPLTIPNFAAQQSSLRSTMLMI